MCWVIGQFIAVGILNGFIHWDNQWSYRIPFAVQWVCCPFNTVISVIDADIVLSQVWPLPIILAAFFAPESPWWLIRHGRLDEAKAAVQKLVTPRADIDFDIDAHVEVMRLTIEFEAQANGGGGHYWDCFRGADLRRTEISAVTW